MANAFLICMNCGSLLDKQLLQLIFTNFATMLAPLLDLCGTGK